MSPKAIGILIALAVVTFLLFTLAPFAQVNVGQKGIVLSNGAYSRTLEPGLHWLTPVVDSVIKIDVQTQKEQVGAAAASKDLQTVTTQIAVNYNIESDKVVDLFTKVGENYSDKLIAPAIQEVVKAATAKYTAEELITNRALVTQEMQVALATKLATSGINVTSVSVINFDFSPRFNAAIEAKVTAEQEALAAKNKLQQVQFEAQQKVATAEAEAKSIMLQSQAAQNEKYVQLQQLEVQKEFANKWNGVLPVNIYGSAPIPFLQLSK